MIGSCNCPIKGVQLQLCGLTVVNTAIYAPVTFDLEEIVIVMIKAVI